MNLDRDRIVITIVVTRYQEALSFQPLVTFIKMDKRNEEDRDKELTKQLKLRVKQETRYNVRFRVSFSVYLMLLGSAVAVSVVYGSLLVDQTATWSVFISGTAGFLCMYLVLHIFFPRWTWDGYGFVLPVKKAVLITSCDTKLGYYIVKRLDSSIITVFAGTNNPDGELPRRLTEECTNRVVILPLDVTSDESVASAMKTMEEVLMKRNHDLWGIVNNATITVRGEIEWIPVDLFKQLAEVNVYGMVQITKAVLPQIRRTKGRIINMHNMQSNLSGSGCAAHAMSESAVESFSTSLRYEMQHWGVKVCSIEINRNFKGIDDVINSQDLWDRMDEKSQRHYGRSYYEKCIASWERECESGDTDLRPVVLSTIDGLWARIPQNTYYTGTLKGRLKTFVHSILSPVLYDRVVHPSHPVKPSALVH